MSNNLYCCSKPFLITIIAAMFAGFYHQAYAQSGSPRGINYDGDAWRADGTGGNNLGWGVALNIGYDIPAHNLKETFKATPTYGVSILKTFKAFTFNLSAGYHAYNAKKETVAYFPEDPASPVYLQKPLKVYAFYAGGAYNINLSEMTFYAGANIGAYFTRSVYQQIDGVVRTTVTTTEQNVYFAPKLGLTYPVTEKVGLGVEGKYNFFIPRGQPDQGGLISYSSYAANIVLSYSF
ncbi:hypothetical protein DJ568_12820 [Mucilaginibacter hurinus]|uniref:Outer membrane protein beta-barrel domain-containing protein n=1 Tax=Mucilaginibacter hurinus TaxID=2201324 RepID=A0A367GNC8_9SPHI|nr:hypothetical protein [Mucilaginibacter hurinus]RCH54181.1 hypothetical protein DJ568_12820 [Mucilaginibacter hurinus]